MTQEAGYRGQDERLDKTALVAGLAVLGAGLAFLLAMVFVFFPEWIRPRAFAPGSNGSAERAVFRRLDNVRVADLPAEDVQAALKQRNFLPVRKTRQPTREVGDAGPSSKDSGEEGTQPSGEDQMMPESGSLQKKRGLGFRGSLEADPVDAAEITPERERVVELAPDPIPVIGSAYTIIVGIVKGKAPDFLIVVDAAGKQYRVVLNEQTEVGGTRSLRGAITIHDVVRIDGVLTRDGILVAQRIRVLPATHVVTGTVVAKGAGSVTVRTGTEVVVVSVGADTVVLVEGEVRSLHDLKVGERVTLAGRIDRVADGAGGERVTGAVGTGGATATVGGQEPSAGSGSGGESGGSVLDTTLDLLDLLR